MADIVLTVELEQAIYERLLMAANEMGVTPAALAGGAVSNYLEENYG